jgi:hypothetical protein
VMTLNYGRILYRIPMETLPIDAFGFPVLCRSESSECLLGLLKQTNRAFRSRNEMQMYRNTSIECTIGRRFCKTRMARGEGNLLLRQGTWGIR